MRIAAIILMTIGSFGIGAAVLLEIRHAEPILRPFLEKQGYRDLLWWNSK